MTRSKSTSCFHATAGAIPSVAIGARLAAHRAQRGIKVSALARQIGVSPSLISQIERGQSRPSVSTLFALAEALDVPVDAFFRDGDRSQPAPGPSGSASSARPRRAIASSATWYGAAERSAIDIEGGVRWERLTPAPLDDLEFMELVYGPGAESHAALYRHPGMEMVLVLSGTLVIFLGFERYELEAGRQHLLPVLDAAPLPEPDRGDHPGGHGDPPRRGDARPPDESEETIGCSIRTSSRRTG